MALTDEVPYVQITSPDYRPAHKSELMAYLEKAAEDTNPATSLETDEEKKPSGKANQLYEDPGERSGEGHDARWGEEPHMAGGRHEPFHNNDATYDSSVDTRRGVLKRTFENAPSIESSTQKDMSSLFDHVSSGDFMTRTALLQSKTKTSSSKHGNTEPSLSERVRKLTGGL